MQGDSLSIFLGLLFFALGTAVTAYSVDGAKRRNLLIIAGLFTLLAIAWWLFPTGSLGTPAQLLQRLLLLVPLLTVSLVVVMVRGRPAPEAAPAPAPTSSPEAKRRSELVSVAGQVNAARYDAKQALVGRGKPGAAVAEMESALASVRRVFGVDTPPGASDRARQNLEVWLDYFDAVWPFLSHGNVDDARAKATAFIAERSAEGLA